VYELEDDLSITPVELWVPGSAVVALGAGGGGEEATLAVWQVSPQGAPTGAWSVPQVEAFTSAETARRFLTLIERRAITAINPDAVDDVVKRLSVAGEIDDDQWWTRQVFSTVQAFQEILAQRTAIEATVNEARTRRKNVAALEWARDLSGSAVPEDVEGLRRLAGLGVVPCTPAGAEAITVARVLRWLVKVWAETEQVKNRRSYVREALGEPQALPPSWLAAVQVASATVLPL
jgi:Family of unknown function (DUF6218)